MVLSGRGRYSKYIRPISIAFDIVAIAVLPLYFFRELNVDFWRYEPYQIVTWAVLAYFIGFYEVYRYTAPVAIISKLIKQAILFLLIVIAFFPFAKETVFSGKAIAKFIGTSFIFITVFKFLLFYYLKKYRIITGSNFRNTVIIGYTPEAIRLKELFTTRPDYGYRFNGFFSDKSNPNVLGNLNDLKQFVIQKNIDDIYCSLSEITNAKLKDLVEFADEQHKIIKFIPDTKDIFTKNLKVDYYGLFPVLSLRKTPLHGTLEKFVKRVFDIAFSLLVIIFVLSWLAPIMAILIKLESKGPIFFKQSRPGINEKEFFCYKFRSMHLNETTETSVTKNDPRVTRIGKFIRKTSIDELPQFINVLLGEMSVVGPRPHLWSQNKMYSNKIKKYIVRLYVKPGITGLAQVRGFRGEIETDEDMINRIKYDVFYIENWSLILDIKIIFQTVVNIFKGEEKAY
ncbi:undecaprenyl-phosphate glucose phosphotransferase [Flavobacterium cyanobacteriorum]|uniref:Undecaprenyl-phosphate glucose phosphotransferase n=1 Tax=Flavobacterium cyanobacteriorum TaxID=2022802 RepID=A0A255YX84_9FLAO|nr:undecaprenyl-phosphate glucose phosphotransferase [Flavobacterium cyanobacteriorum]OYQ33304.1 undecaprenyl-phosphate glucose phosphotransferase [Flavobacterium cyanobacteriorum]